jgi:hypothetical protein
MQKVKSNLMTYKKPWIPVNYIWYEPRGMVAYGKEYIYIARYERSDSVWL